MNEPWFDEPYKGSHWSKINQIQKHKRLYEYDHNYLNMCCCLLHFNRFFRRWIETNFIFNIFFILSSFIESFDSNDPSNLALESSL